jgi:hypothetical protein
MEYGNARPGASRKYNHRYGLNHLPAVVVELESVSQLVSGALLTASPNAALAQNPLFHVPHRGAKVVDAVLAQRVENGRIFRMG